MGTYKAFAVGRNADLTPIGSCFAEIDFIGVGHVSCNGGPGVAALELKVRMHVLH